MCISCETLFVWLGLEPRSNMKETHPARGPERDGKILKQCMRHKPHPSYSDPLRTKSPCYGRSLWPALPKHEGEYAVKVSMRSEDSLWRVLVVMAGTRTDHAARKKELRYQARAFHHSSQTRTQGLTTACGCQFLSITHNPWAGSGQVLCILSQCATTTQCATFFQVYQIPQVKPLVLVRFSCLEDIATYTHPQLQKVGIGMNVTYVTVLVCSRSQMSWIHAL